MPSKKKGTDRRLTAEQSRELLVKIESLEADIEMKNESLDVLTSSLRRALEERGKYERLWDETCRKLGAVIVLNDNAVLSKGVYEKLYAQASKLEERSD